MTNERARGKPLREGVTTGSSATAAAAAALEVLLTGTAPGVVAVLPPPFDARGEQPARIRIPLAACEKRHENGLEYGYAAVIKDGGDDPDATNGMLLTATVAFTPLEGKTAPLDLGQNITLYAGEGIGVATLPGLPVAAGEMAVNPGPRSQIAAALRETADRLGCTAAIHCRIAAPEGEKRATKTLNPRLGIVGGISILGTRGTVKPFSTEAWQATIAQGLDVAVALGEATVVLTTGRRSERAMQERFPDLPPHAFIQAADHAGFALEAAASRNVAAIYWGCFPGKLLKLAQGLGWTHARSAPTDFALLAATCKECGLSDSAFGGLMQEAMRLPTVSGALDVIRTASPETFSAVIGALARKAHAAMLPRVTGGGKSPHLCLFVFDMQGTLLAETD